MDKLTDPGHLLSKQYKDSSNLADRFQLHARFSTNSQGWAEWVFEQFNLPAACSILELGCGRGKFWLENINRIPRGWRITLSDFSEGMLQDAEVGLSQCGKDFRFEIIDAEQIPFDDDSFDAIIANHMLYHVPDRSAVFSEIGRVLKTDGRFYATTIGEAHMLELRDLMVRANPNAYVSHHSDRFGLENGTEQLSQWFSEVCLSLYQDSLEVTEVGPLVSYVRSTNRLDDEQLMQFEAIAKEELTARRVLKIRKSVGLFVAISTR